MFNQEKSLDSFLVAMKQKTLPANKTTDTDSEIHFPLEALHFPSQPVLYPMAVRYVSPFFEWPSVGEHSEEAGGELYQL